MDHKTPEMFSSGSLEVLGCLELGIPSTAQVAQAAVLW